MNRPLKWCGVFCRGTFVRSAMVVIGLSFALGGTSKAEQVDVELLLLVDTSVVVSQQNFDDLLDGYASAFESSEVIDALQGGTHGSIAASLVLFSGAALQTVAVPWTSISDAVTAQAFATSIRSAARPPASFFSSISSALDFATAQFGTETGNAPNGFESSTQAINMTTETFLFVGESASSVRAGRDRALAAGVDVINALTVGTFNAGGASNYYQNNIVGGEANGVPGTVDNSLNYAALIGGGASVALETQLISAVPEPESLLLALFGTSLLAMRRRRA